MKTLIQGKSGTTPVMSRNAFNTNQGTNEDDSQSDHHPEAGIFGNQTMRKSGQKDRRDTVGSREIRLTWAEHPRCGTLSCWDSFLVTLPSTSSETCAIYSSVIPAADEFCNCLFLGYSCVSLDITANFRLFLSVSIFKKMFNSGQD